MGGPSNIPTIPKVAISEIAIPGEYVLEAPAKVYVMGITEAVPKPTKEKPIMAGQKLGSKIANIIPVKINEALMI